MSQGNESSLRFSLEESVWFQKGQEVEELISISLDPNITIHENDQYVTIEGALCLTGEYKRFDVENVEEEFPSSSKFIQQVEERGEGICEFSHRFPIDITIPKNRIQSIYEIDVEVEAFDYAFAERSCMKLTADLTITGLYGEQQHAPVEEDILEKIEIEPIASIDREIPEEPHAPTLLDETVDEELFTPFEAEARKTGDQEELDGNNAFLQDEKNKEKTFILEKAATPEISFLSQREEVQIPSEEMEESESEPEVEDEVEEESIPEELEELESPPVQQKQAKKKKKSKKEPMSITEFLARKDENEDVVKLKVCIVQSGDTIDSLAERYDVPAQQLLRVNQLELNQDVHEGQVLYIPATLAHK